MGRFEILKFKLEFDLSFFAKETFVVKETLEKFSIKKLIFNSKWIRLRHLLFGAMSKWRNLLFDSIRRLLLSM
jgi:hypothetical protein